MVTISPNGKTLPLNLFFTSVQYLGGKFNPSSGNLQ